MTLNWNRISKLWGGSVVLVGLLALLAGSRVGRADDVVKPNGTITYTATRTLVGNGLNIATPTFVPPGSYTMGKVAGGHYAQFTNAVPDAGMSTFSPDGPDGVGVTVMFAVASLGESFLVDLNGILTTGGSGKGKGGGQIIWNANEVVTPTFKIAAGTPQAKPAVVVEKEQTAVKFQVQLYNGPSSNKQPATEVTSQTYTLAPSVSGSGVKIDAVQALEGQTWTMASGGSQAIVTIHGPSKQVSFSVTATVESSKPGIMSVKLSGQVTLASGKTLSAAATPPARFSVAAVQYTEYYDNGSTALPKTEDKVVEFKRPQQGADLPADRFLQVCKIKLKKPTLVDVNITLKNPDGHLGLFKANVTGLNPTPQGPITLTLPKDGTTAKFKLSGETVSTAVNDSKLNAYLNKHNKKNGSASTHDAGDVKFTVFSFGKVPGSSFQETYLNVDKAYSTIVGLGWAIVLPRNYDAIKISAEADILPNALGRDWSTNPILHPYQINFVQNVLKGGMDEFIYHVEPATALFNAGTKLGTVALVSSSMTAGSTFSKTYDDSTPTDLPFYTEGKHVPPANAAGGGAASDTDGPDTKDLLSITQIPIFDSNLNIIGGVDYKATKITLAVNFHDWGVVEDTSTKTVNYVLSEAKWDVNFPALLPIANPSFGFAQIHNFDQVPTDFPVLTGSVANVMGTISNEKVVWSKAQTKITANAANTAPTPQP